jgi:hypothetical protein
MIQEDPISSTGSDYPGAGNSTDAGTGPSADTVTAAATKAWETTREKAGEALHTGERYVREHPGTSVLSIFGLGFLLGILVGWSAAKEDDYATYARKLARRWGHKLNLD